MVHINRVAKVVKGGRRFSFSALVVVGDGNGVVGVGLGKAGEVPEAIRKGIERARKNLIRVPLRDGDAAARGARAASARARVLLRPASPGTGVIAGGACAPCSSPRACSDVLTKSLGTQQPAQRGARDADGARRAARSGASGARELGRVDDGRSDAEQRAESSWVKSMIGYNQRQRATLRGLGLRRLQPDRGARRTRPRCAA